MRRMAKTPNPMTMSLVSDGFSMDGTAAGSARTASEELCAADEVSRIELMSHSNAGLPVGNADVPHSKHRESSDGRRPGSRPLMCPT